MKVEPKINFHPVEIYGELAFVIAHCIGADRENEEEIANSVPIEFRDAVCRFIREEAPKYEALKRI